MIDSPFYWPEQLLTMYGRKGPMLIWLGQFFVPLGTMMSSVDIGLLLLEMVILFISVTVMLKILEQLFDDRVISLTGCLVMISAPLMFGMATHYWVEPLQLLAVVWFLFIAVHLNKRDNRYTFMQLISATCFAMLVKVSSPLYCLFPGSIILLHLLRRGSQSGTMVTRRPWQAVLTSFLLFLAAAWYVSNWRTAIGHALASSSPLKGVHDTFFNKLFYWLQTIQKAFFIKPVWYVLIFLFMFALISAVKNKKISFFIKTSPSNILMLAACGTIMLFLAMFSTVTNISIRFVLPLLPYVALLFCWLLKQLNSRSVTLSVLTLFIIQFIIVNLYFFNIIPWNYSLYKYPLKPIQWEKNITIASELDTIVKVTCPDESGRRLNILGVNTKRLSLRQLRYYTAKKKLPQQVQCSFESMGHTIGTGNRFDPDTLFKSLIERKPAYYFSLRQDILKKYMSKKTKITTNKTQLKKMHADLGVLTKVMSSDQFEVVPLPGQGDIRIYKFIGKD
jgi:hypothetical protein